MKFPGSLTALLSGIVDYAGLFPPAALSMHDAVRNYAHYRDDQDEWALGKFIVPVARLSEFMDEFESFSSKSRPWKLSVLPGSSIDDDLRTISEFNASVAGKAEIDTIEAKAATIDGILDLTSIVPKSFQLFIEIPTVEDPSELIRAIGERGACAKVRTGGVIAEAFPSSIELARFLAACVKLDVRFKATAGLHHPVRSVFNLTYEADSEKGRMFGYLNLFLATAFLREGMNIEDVISLLEEESSSAFAFDDAGISWRSHRIGADSLRRTREHMAASFGSCSFADPMNELRAMIALVADPLPR